MKYKISDTPLKMREYGRNIQAMVEYIKTLDDREKRTKLAKEIIIIMGNLQPQIKEYPDYKQKLWDSLFLIADFNLDVDSPFPAPSQEMFGGKKEKRMEYYSGKPSYRQYGYNVELMVQQAIKMEEGEAKKKYINLLANTMNQFLWNMNRNSTPETVIAGQIKEISKGKIKVKPEDLTLHKIVPSKNNPRNQSSSYSGKRKKKKKRNY
ncbi:MAG: DUF4290 domain-containing protein [Bacteroidota bacterium]